MATNFNNLVSYWIQANDMLGVRSSGIAFGSSVTRALVAVDQGVSVLWSTEATNIFALKTQNTDSKVGLMDNGGLNIGPVWGTGAIWDSMLRRTAAGVLQPWNLQTDTAGSITIGNQANLTLNPGPLTITDGAISSLYYKNQLNLRGTTNNNRLTWNSVTPNAMTIIDDTTPAEFVTVSPTTVLKANATYQMGMGLTSADRFEVREIATNAKTFMTPFRVRSENGLGTYNIQMGSGVVTVDGTSNSYYQASDWTVPASVTVPGGSFFGTGATFGTILKIASTCSLVFLSLQEVVSFTKAVGAANSIIIVGAVPAAFRPTQDRYMGAVVSAGSNPYSFTLTVASSGDIYLFQNADHSGGSWTLGTTYQIPRQCLIYSIT